MREMQTNVITLEDIEQETDKRRLLSFAHHCEGDARLGLTTPEHYGRCMVALALKLGFSITSENLERAKLKYLVARDGES